jgi:hypothetical protein
MVAEMFARSLSPSLHGPKKLIRSSRVVLIGDQSLFMSGGTPLDMERKRHSENDLRPLVVPLYGHYPVSLESSLCVMA